MTTAQLLKEMARVEKDAQGDHARLRGDFTALELRMTAHLAESAKDRNELTELNATLAELGRRKTDFDSLRFPPKVVISVAATVVAIVLYFGNAIYSVQTSIGTLVSQLSKSEQQVATNETVTKARQEVADAKVEGLRADVTDIKRQMNLMQLQMQALDKTVSAKGR